MKTEILMGGEVCDKGECKCVNCLWGRVVIWKRTKARDSLPGGSVR